ncbi:MAG: hypothetical protein PXY39_05365 [archaeon]|nr:hypothetical protein [archaeon]
MTFGTARPDRDAGEVGHRQDDWLAENLRKNMESENSDHASSHCSRARYWNRQKTIVDAGDILRTLFIERANLKLGIDQSI